MAGASVVGCRPPDSALDISPKHQVAYLIKMISGTQGEDTRPPDDLRGNMHKNGLPGEIRPSFFFAQNGTEQLESVRLELQPPKPDAADLYPHLKPCMKPAEASVRRLPQALQHSHAQLRTPKAGKLLFPYLVSLWGAQSGQKPAKNHKLQNTKKDTDLPVYLTEHLGVLTNVTQRYTDAIMMALSVELQQTVTNILQAREAALQQRIADEEEQRRKEQAERRNVLAIFQSIKRLADQQDVRDHAASVIQRAWRAHRSVRAQDQAAMDRIMARDVQKMLGDTAMAAVRAARRRAQAQASLARIRRELSRKRSAITRAQMRISSSGYAVGAQSRGARTVNMNLELSAEASVLTTAAPGGTGAGAVVPEHDQLRGRRQRGDHAALEGSCSQGDVGADSDGCSMRPELTRNLSRAVLYQQSIAATRKGAAMAAAAALAAAVITREAEMTAQGQQEQAAGAAGGSPVDSEAQMQQLAHARCVAWVDSAADLVHGADCRGLGGGVGTGDAAALEAGSRSNGPDALPSDHHHHQQQQQQAGAAADGGAEEASVAEPAAGIARVGSRRSMGTPGRRTLVHCSSSDSEMQAPVFSFKMRDKVAALEAQHRDKSPVTWADRSAAAAFGSPTKFAAQQQQGSDPQQQPPLLLRAPSSRRVAFASSSGPEPPASPHHYASQPPMRRSAPDRSAVAQASAIAASLQARLRYLSENGGVGGGSSKGEEPGAPAGAQQQQQHPTSPPQLKSPSMRRARFATSPSDSDAEDERGSGLASSRRAAAAAHHDHRSDAPECSSGDEAGAGGMGEDESPRLSPRGSGSGSGVDPLMKAHAHMYARAHSISYGRALTEVLSSSRKGSRAASRAASQHPSRVTSRNSSWASSRHEADAARTEEEEEDQEPSPLGADQLGALGGHRTSGGGAFTPQRSRMSPATRMSAAAAAAVAAVDGAAMSEAGIPEEEPDGQGAGRSSGSGGSQVSASAAVLLAPAPHKTLTLASLMAMDDEGAPSPSSSQPLDPCAITLPRHAAPAEAPSPPTSHPPSPPKTAFGAMLAAQPPGARMQHARAALERRSPPIPVQTAPPGSPMAASPPPTPPRSPTPPSMAVHPPARPHRLVSPRSSHPQLAAPAPPQQQQAAKAAPADAPAERPAAVRSGPLFGLSVRPAAVKQPAGAAAAAVAVSGNEGAARSGGSFSSAAGHPLSPMSARRDHLINSGDFSDAHHRYQQQQASPRTSAPTADAPAAAPAPDAPHRRLSAPSLHLPAISIMRPASAGPTGSNAVPQAPPSPQPTPESSPLSPSPQFTRLSAPAVVSPSGRPTSPSPVVTSVGDRALLAAAPNSPSDPAAAAGFSAGPQQLWPHVAQLPSQAVVHGLKGVMPTSLAQAQAPGRQQQQQRPAPGSLTAALMGSAAGRAQQTLADTSGVAAFVNKAGAQPQHQQHMKQPQQQQASPVGLRRTSLTY